MHLVLVSKGFYAVYATAGKRDQCELLEFLGGLGPNLQKDRDRMLALLERVALEGPPRNTEISRRIKGKLFEFIQGRLRLLWFYDEGRLIICTSGFVKKSRRSPRYEIEHAIQVMSNYFEDKKRGEIQIYEEEGVWMKKNSFKELFCEAKERDTYWVASAILDFTEGLHKIMEASGITRSDLARRLRVSPAYITKVLRGNVNFTVDSMVRLVRAAGGEISIHVAQKTKTERDNSYKKQGIKKAA